MPKENKVPDIELRERYKVVQNLIKEGYSGADVWRHIRDKTHWNISRRQAYNYFADAFDALADESGINRAAYFKLSLDRLQWLYRKAVDQEDWKQARLLTLDLIGFLKLDSPDADFDWQKDATAAGLDPKNIVERLKRLTADDEAKNHAHG